MRVISRRRLREFWGSRKHDARIAERDLSTWFTIAKAAEWANFAALKQTFGSADQVGNCIVFDAGNNRYRVIGRVSYARGRLYILKALDHAAYDKGRWIDQCGCYRLPPKKDAGAPGHRPSTPRRRKGGR
jgi:mRNA interferase HigB